MIFKAFILLVAVCHVSSSPISIEPVEKQTISDSIVPGKETVEQSVPSIQTLSASIQSVSPLQQAAVSPIVADTEKKLVRTARNDKIEYIYVTPDGEILPNQKAYSAKNLIREFVLADKTDQPAEKTAASPKEVLTGRSAESIAEPKHPESDEKSSGSDLHYAGSIKVRTEKSRHSNALPTTPTGLAQSSPLIASQPIAGQPFYYSNELPLIPTLVAPSSFSYPVSYPVLAQSTYYAPQPSLVSRATVSPSPVVAPVVSPVVAPVVSPVVSPVVAPAAPEEIEIRRRPYSQIGAYDFIPPLFSDVLENRFLPIGPYLVGRALNGLLQPASLVSGSPNYPYNPFLSYLLPQQTPNLNYLLGRSISGIGGGLNGLNGYYGNGYYPSASTLYPSTLYPSTLYPQTNPASLLYPYLAYPQYSQYPQYPALYPPYSPQIANPIVPSASIVPQVAPADFVTRRTVEPAITETVTTVTSGVQPFSDSTTVQPSSAAASSVLIPGLTEGDSVIEKPLLYSSQSAALRLPYDASYSGYSNGYLGAYPGRIIDPTTGLPTSTYLSPYNRYPSTLYPSSSSGYYSRYSYPYSSYPGAYSGYYRPGLVSPVYGPYNGVGYVSPMHYSADASALNRKSSEDTKPAVAPAKEQATVGKDGNLMYSIKTSKTESKETVSRLKQAIDTNKIREDDKKAA